MLAESSAAQSLAGAVLSTEGSLTLSNAPFWMWWLIPVVATLLVVGVLRFVVREYRPRGSFRSVADFDRFRETMHHRRIAQEADQRE
ncbi:MAG: hypothetical protein ACRC0L_09295 [Angustibacter sp.]